METMRDGWTDERMDDFSHRMDQGLVESMRISANCAPIWPAVSIGSIPNWEDCGLK